LNIQQEITREPSVAEIVHGARVLASMGRHREAIDLLSFQPIEALDVGALTDLVHWRSAAFEPEQGRAVWPPQFADPFPDVVGAPPEIKARNLTAEILGGAVHHHGGLIVRGLIDQEQTSHLAGVVQKAFDAAGECRSGAVEPDASPWYARYPLSLDEGIRPQARVWVEEGGGVLTADSPRALADFIAFLKAHGVTRVIEQYLGERAFLSLGKSTLRIVPPDAGSGWHQDGSFLGPDIRTINVWLALSDCGEDAPGLDVYPRRLNSLAETGTRGAFDWWVVGDGVVDDMSEAAVVAPVFKAGDAMLFDQLYLHRTGVRPGMTRQRMAIESWFFAGSTFPMQQIPLAL
jgi:hypothetical protein